MIGEDAARAVATASHLGQRLQASLDVLKPYHPFGAASLLAVDAVRPDATDAFLKRFENLVNHLQDQVWRGIVVEEGYRDPGEMSRRDIADQMEKLGLLSAEQAFRDVVRIRNRLAHLYPDEPARQAVRLNEAYAAAALLLDCVAPAEA